MKLKKRAMSALTMLTVLTGTAFMPAHAANRYYNNYSGYANRYYSGSKWDNFSYNHPYAQKALIVGGAGAAAGALLGAEGDRMGSAVKGALLGAGAGVGYEYLRQKGLLPW